MKAEIMLNASLKLAERKGLAKCQEYVQNGRRDTISN
jgi:hypothetical protein